MIKFVLLAVIFGCCALVGVMVANFFHHRRNFFADLCAFCETAKVMILFSQEKILNIVHTCKDSYKTEFFTCLDEFEQYLQGKNNTFLNLKNQNFLSSDEKKIVANFFKNLGSMTQDEEVEKLANNKKTFDQIEQTSLAEDKKLSGLYLKLFIILGSFFVVIFL